MSKLTIVAWALAVAFVSGCNERADGAGSSANTRGCFHDEQCEAGELCVFRLCNPGCNADRSCDPGAMCFDTSRGPACLQVGDNACVDADDCPMGATCVDRRCETTCASGDASCRNCEGGLCPPGDDDDPIDGGTAGASGTGAAGAGGGAGAAPMCTPGSLSCRDNLVIRCGDDSRPRTERACPFVCRNGACTGSCVPGELRCSGGMRQRCDEAGSWTTVEMCRNACTPGGCTDVCADGTRQCDGNTVTICRSGRQIDVQRCEYVCRDGACGGSCVPGSRQCRDNSVMTCSADGSWGMPVACLNACINAACSGECVPGTQRCGSNTSYQVCNARGQWSGNVDCRGQACMDGECSGECAPGETRCAGASAVATCGANGRWGMPQICGNGEICTGEGTCSTGCRPDQLPVWFGMGGGVDRDLDDLRWGGAPDSFASGSGPMLPTSYAIVYDESSETLAVQVRVLGDDMPTPDDFVYFGIASAAGTDGVAVRIALAAPGPMPMPGPGPGPGPEGDPRSLQSVAGYVLQANAWSETGGRREFVSRTGGWLQSDGVAWAVSFYVDLDEVGIDPATPVRIALGTLVQSASGTTQSTTPASLDVRTPLGARAQDWPVVNLDAIECTARVSLP